MSELTIWWLEKLITLVGFVCLIAVWWLVGWLVLVPIGLAGLGYLAMVLAIWVADRREPARLKAWR